MKRRPRSRARLRAPARVDEVRVAGVDDDVALVEQRREVVDHAVDGRARLDHDDDPARPLERRDERPRSTRCPVNAPSSPNSSTKSRVFAAVRLWTAIGHAAAGDVAREVRPHHGEPGDADLALVVQGDAPLGFGPERHMLAQMRARRVPGMPLGIGLAALGRPGYINLGHAADIADHDVARMEAAAHGVLDAAYDGGIRHYDAARSYGRAEAFLASWLAAAAWGATTSRSARSGGTPTPPAGGGRRGARGQGATAAQLRRQWPETEALLGEHLRLYQIHSATLESGVLDDADVRGGAGGAARARRAGRAQRHRRRAGRHDRPRGGDRRLRRVQATWNLLERSAGPALERPMPRGSRSIVKEALANGRLTARGGSRRSRRRRASAAWATDALALAAALAQPWAGVVLSGAATVAQLESNLAARDVAWDDALDERLAALAEAPDAYWDARSALPWT